MEHLRMGSLFDGSGGFPLAAVLYGIEPVWASEIEPFPIKVTRARFPNMKHYGDIGQMNGAELEPVDLISGGSPCQDMSIAGKRAGLDGERSCLFRDQIRIIKEMREATNGQYPRFMLWENVTGAFSSNKGEDFRSVLEETARIKDENVVIPGPPKGKWSGSGCIVGDGWSVAWRVLDAQYWGVPQRRRRIALVADFRGECAGEILFKREGLCRNFTESRSAWQGTAGGASEGVGEAGEQPIFSLDREAMNAGYEFDRAPGVDENGIAYTLKATGPGAVAHQAFTVDADSLRCGDKCRCLVGDHNNRITDMTALVVEPCTIRTGSQSDVIHMNAEKAQSLCAGPGGKGVHTGLYCLPKEPVTMQIRCGKEGGGKGALLQYDKSATLGCNNTQTLFQPVQKDLYCMATQQGGAEIGNDLAPTIIAAAGMSGNNQSVINQPVDKIYCVENSTGRNTLFMTENVSPTLVADTHNHACCIPIQDQDISNGNGNGLGIGREEDPMYTLMADTQHGVAYSLQGNMIGREDHNGPQGGGVNEDVSFTLNATDRHAVCYGIDQQGGKGGANYTVNVAPTMCADSHGTPHAVCYGIDRAAYNQGKNALYDFSIEEDKAQTLVARGPGAVNQPCSCTDVGWLSSCEEVSPTLLSRMYKDPHLVSYQDKCGSLMASGYNKLGTQESMNDMYVANEYIVRRLTPLECSRLQGFPDCWTEGVEIQNPSEEELCFWREVFETHRKIVTGASKPKTDKQIIKWLQEGHNDGAEYKMWGNGIALPCFLYVMEGIANVLNKERCDGQPLVCEFQRGVCCYPIEDCENCPVRKVFNEGGGANGSADE